MSRTPCGGKKKRGFFMVNELGLLAPTRRSLVGRGEILGELEKAVEALADGTGGVHVYEGSAGVGKTSVLAYAAAAATQHGIHVAAGGATELDRLVPLSSLLACLDRGRAHLPQLRDLPEDIGKRHLLEDVASHLDQTLRTRRLLISIDDAHHLDELSALALRTLVPAFATRPVLWLLARRPCFAPNPAHNAVDSLLAHGALACELGTLHDDDVERLCTEVLGTRPAPDLLALVVRTGGNPFLCDTLLRSLRDAGRLRVADGRVRLVTTPGDRVGTPLRDGYFRMLSRLLSDVSEDTHRLLQAGAVLGRPFTVHEAAGLTGRPAAELVHAATEAVASGTLRGGDSTLSFRYEVIQDAVYARLSEPVRLALHREAAAVVQAEGGDPSEVADHLLRSGHHGEAEAVEVLRDAVRQRAASAPEEAADLALQLLDLLDDDTPPVHELTVEAMHLLAVSGRAREARALGERALHRGVDAATETQLLSSLADVLLRLGDNEAANEYSRRALARTDLPRSARAELLAMHAYSLASSGDMDEADRVGAAAVEFGEQSFRSGPQVLGLISRSIVALNQGDLGQSLTMARSAVRTADAAGPDVRRYHPRLWLTAAHMALDRFDEAEAVLALYEREAEGLGVDWAKPLWHYQRARLRLSTGRIKEAEAEAMEGIRRADEPSTRWLASSLLTLCSEVELRSGDLDTARQTLARAEQLAGVSGTPRAALVWRKVLLQEAGGEAQQALHTVTGVYGSPRRMRAFLTRCPVIGPTLVRLALRAGTTAQVPEIITMMDELVTANPGVTSLAAAATHARGLAANDTSRLAAAVQLYRWTLRPIALAMALEDAAAAEQRAGNLPSAQIMLEEAAHTWTTCGAHRDADRAHDALRACRARGGHAEESPRTPPPPERSITVKGDDRWSSLTMSERRVTRLVAQGLTNRKIASRLHVSPHTVDTHLRRSFMKLNVSNRVELTLKVMAYEETRPSDLTHT
ncbi:helix-turn-helix transcriptional regulator [Streptomyces sp. NRRL B-1347]|uniref:helix-turn-helix transcriptional regulator n=1 Tax=Streptomyces sp. NRRL B-1347 TaxID=1476877 RepID=UPI00099B78BC|nr:LuxR family transcriptional regulator [Streptomyces sp. NRRL B-1347]